ncbi:MAG: hypothetical protein ACRETB_08190 [Steroidobacteraceae bacterium]
MWIRDARGTQTGHEHGAAYYVVRKNKWIRICGVDEGEVALHQKLFALNHSGTDAAAPVDMGTVSHAILSYLEEGMAQLSQATRKTYRATGMRMLHHWGKYRLEEIQHTHVAQFLKWCRKTDRAVLGNREKAFMSSVYEYARGEGWTSSNPFRGVKRNMEHPSSEEVSSELLAQTLDRAPPHLLPLLALAYLWGMRQTDMRNLTFDAVKAGAVRWRESKTPNKNQQEITSSVGYFLQMAADYRESVAQRYEKAAAKLAA